MFADKLKKANDSLKVDEKILDEIKARSDSNLSGTGTFNRYAFAALSMVLVAAIVLAMLFVPHSDVNNVVPADNIQRPQPMLPVKTAESYADIFYSVDKLMSDARVYENSGAVMFDGAAINAVAGGGADDFVYTSDVPKSESIADSAEKIKKEYSGTNVQVSGVDEGDYIKTDGRYIYIFRNGSITIVDAVNMQELSTIPFDGKGYYGQCDMYVKEDVLVVIYSYNTFDAAYRTADDEEKISISDAEYEDITELVYYDISDRSAPQKIHALTQSGRYVSSRLVGKYLYTVSSYYIYNEAVEERPETYIPKLSCGDEVKTLPACDICMPDNAQSAAYTVVTAADITGTDDFISSKAVFGDAGQIYADTDNLLVANTVAITESEETLEDDKALVINTSEAKTKLTLFSLDNGLIESVAMGEVKGSLLNQFSIDEYNGYYRLVTTASRDVTKIYTDGIDYYENEYTTTNGLYVLDSGLNTVGTIDGLAEDERVYSVRFDGDIAYFVTFRQVDPLFAVDLSRPTEPVILSALKIPGFSQYLHMYDDGLLFGLGQDANAETGEVLSMKLSMFDVSNPVDVTEKHTLKIDCNWSEALYNHKAIVISKSENIIAFPTGNGYAIYGYDNSKGFYEQAIIDIESDKWRLFFRGMYIGNEFFVCTDNDIYCYSMSDFKEKAHLELSEVSQEENFKYMIVD